MSPRRILIAEDDASLRRITAMQLEESGYAVTEAKNGLEALERLKSCSHDLVLADLVMDGCSGLDVLKQVRLDCPSPPVIIITAFGSVQTAVEAMKLGAWDYITKPVHPQELQIAVSRALEHVRLTNEVTALRSALDLKHGFSGIVGQSKVLLEVLEKASRIAQTDATILIEGETGTGKELLARAIHLNSRRAAETLVTINCAAIPRELIESELFGHVRGAFTGAVANVSGRAEMADRGTLFLDEIGELPLEMQAKLLRLVQEREIEKIGARTRIKTDIRVLAATNRDLKLMVREGRFREDLYYRLAVVALTIPPLRDRTDDIPLLVQHSFAKHRERHHRPNLAFPNALFSYFNCAYPWPGNVRELENIVERLRLSPGLTQTVKSVSTVR